MEELALDMQSNGFTEIKQQIDTNTLIKEELEKTVEELAYELRQIKAIEDTSFMTELIEKKNSHRFGLTQERVSKEAFLISELTAKVKEDIAHVLLLI